MSIESGSELLSMVKQWMEDKNYDWNTSYSYTQIQKRKEGHVFTLNEHVEALVWSLLSANRPWYQIEQNREKLREVFHNFDAEYLLVVDPDVLTNKVTMLNCGNRRIVQQMEELRYNIQLLQQIDEKIPLHEFDVINTPYNVAKALSEGTLKLKGVAITLAFEFLKNVGVDCAKPDVHLHRLMERWHLPCFNEWEIQDSMQKVAKDNGLLVSQAASIMWQFCATGYFEVCTKEPHCSICPVKEYCESNSNIFK